MGSVTGRKYKQETIRTIVMIGAILLLMTVFASVFAIENSFEKTEKKTQNSPQEISSNAVVVVTKLSRVGRR